MEKRLSIKTYIEKENYRKILYTTTLLRSGKSIPFLLVIAFIAAVLLTFDKSGFNIVKLLVYFIIFLIIATLSIVLKLEKLNKATIKSDNIGLFNSENTLDFYDDQIIIKTKFLEGEVKIPYEYISKVIETKEFYLIYLNNNQASVIRKKDITEIEEKDLRELYKEKLKDKFKFK